jgi:hypothetical protein
VVEEEDNIHYDMGDESVEVEGSSAVEGSMDLLV